mgnify:CR=1 FL=1
MSFTICVTPDNGLFPEDVPAPPITAEATALSVESIPELEFDPEPELEELELDPKPELEPELELELEPDLELDPEPAPATEAMPESPVCISLKSEEIELFNTAFVGQYFEIPSAIFIAPKMIRALPFKQSGLRTSLLIPRAVQVAPQANRVKAPFALKFSSKAIYSTSSL